MEYVINLFNKNQVRYLIIGGQAIRLEGMPRYTMDWDFYIPKNDQRNMDKINCLLEDELDLPLVAIGRKGENFVQTYQTQWGIIQFHLNPMGLPPFDEAEKRRILHKNENKIKVRCICGEDLLACKKVISRDKDQQDIEFLEEKSRLGTLTGPLAN